MKDLKPLLSKNIFAPKQSKQNLKRLFMHVYTAACSLFLPLKTLFHACTDCVLPGASLFSLKTCCTDMEWEIFLNRYSMAQTKQLLHDTFSIYMLYCIACCHPRTLQSYESLCAVPTVYCVVNGPQLWKIMITIYLCKFVLNVYCCRPCMETKIMDNHVEFLSDDDMYVW